SGSSSSGEFACSSPGPSSAARSSGGTPCCAQPSGSATASSGISSSSVGSRPPSWAASGEHRSEADAASAATSRRISGELVLEETAGRAILAAAFHGSGILAPDAGHGFDKGSLLGIGEALPSDGTEAFERAIPDLVLHPLRAFDPVTEVHVGEARLVSAPDMIENDIVPKPRPRLMFRVVEAVDHRQPVSLPIRQAGADQATLPPVRRGFPVFHHKAGNGSVFHHICVIDFIHRGHPPSGMALAKVALQQIELFAGRPGATFGNHQIV